MNKLFKFNSEMTVYILDIWGEEIANNNGTTIKNITYIYMCVCVL